MIKLIDLNKMILENIKYLVFTLLFLILGLKGFSQYASAAGKLGSSALYKDSSIFVNWAKQCTIYRGWKNIAQKDSGYAIIGDSTSAIGKAGENGIVSLGDSGIAICQFYKPLLNGNGWDFAIFENTFDDRYLELAFVEVSSDGWRYFRFPCHSLTDTLNQTGAFGYTEPENINNLAGKYRAGYGTPFDFNDIPDYKDLDKNNIRYVKIVDVVGSLNSKFAAFDTAMRKINDPWPTPFASSGFDLDAIGVIHEQKTSVTISINSNQFIKGPNPIKAFQKLNIDNSENKISSIEIFDAVGKSNKLVSGESSEIEANDLPFGLFFIHFSGPTVNSIYKGLKL